RLGWLAKHRGTFAEELPEEWIHRSKVVLAANHAGLRFGRDLHDGRGDAGGDVPECRRLHRLQLDRRGIDFELYRRFRVVLRAERGGHEPGRQNGTGEREPPAAEAGE